MRTALPNDIRKLSPDLESRALVGRCTQGRSAPFAFDFENSNCILSFGSPLLEASISPVRMLRTYGHLRQERPGPKAKIIQIEPRFSLTAAKADEWVPINPGTEGALALGIAYVLIREGLYDRSFVENHTFGFEDWQDAEGKTHIGFKKLVLQEYNVDAVARVTGVPVATVLRIAKEFAAAPARRRARAAHLDQRALQLDGGPRVERPRRKHRRARRSGVSARGAAEGVAGRGTG